MERMIKSSEVLWLVARDGQHLIGSAVFELETMHRIGKLEGVVVDPAYRKMRIANSMIATGTRALLTAGSQILSIYATTRTVSMGPQLMCLKEGFLPLGIFPNSHRLESYESVTLLAKFQPDVLTRRRQVEAVPARIAPILNIANAVLGSDQPVTVLEPPPHRAAPERRSAHKFEFIMAPRLVERRCHEKFPDPADRFYPFHKPNLLIASEDGEVEIYAFLSRPDRYCVLLAVNVPISTVEDRLSHLFDQLADYGASYIETLIRLDRTEAINSLLELQFLPSAIYPAMREIQGELYDMIIMSRTMEPLNFRGMAVERSFKPYIDQYVDLWRQMYLDTLEVSK